MSARSRQGTPTRLRPASDLGHGERLGYVMKGRGGDSLLWAYYRGIFLVVLVMTARPRLSPWLAMEDSAANR
jgi:hypothetical protein